MGKFLLGVVSVGVVAGGYLLYKRYQVNDQFCKDIKALRQRAVDIRAQFDKTAPVVK